MTNFVAGREQASLTGRRLLEMDLPINKIVHNGQCHTVETSDMIASYLPDTPQEVDISLKDNQQESVEQAVKKYLSVDPSKQSDDSYDLVVCDEDMIKRLISRYSLWRYDDPNYSLQLTQCPVMS